MDHFSSVVDNIPNFNHGLEIKSMSLDAEMISLCHTEDRVPAHGKSVRQPDQEAEEQT